ncbi:MAG: hypothetical protein U9N02_09610 [Campylobacterota bacterium]|nr:hypothetical protein [Campylobacterota bacterium]
MYTEDIKKYLKDFSTYLNKHNHVHIHIKSSIVSRTEDNEVNIHLNDKFETLDIKIFIPLNRKIPATIKIKGDNYNIDTNIGNARNVSLKHDIDVVSQVIIASTKHKEAIEYVKEKLKEIFDHKDTSNNESGIYTKKVKRIDISLRKEELDNIITRANIKGANILKWLRTPNNKIVLIYKYKEDESYGSELETNTHLYYAYMLKNKYPSKRLF